MGGAVGGGDEAAVLHQRGFVFEGVGHLDFDTVGVAIAAKWRVEDQLARGWRRRHHVTVVRGRHKDTHHVLGRRLAANGAVAAAASEHAARRPRRAARTEAAVLVMREAAVRRWRRVARSIPYELARCQRICECDTRAKAFVSEKGENRQIEKWKLK